MNIACVSSAHVLRLGTIMIGQNDRTGANEDQNVSSPEENADGESDRVPGGSFDRWLNAKLMMLYNPVLNEPIPDQLMYLIDEHRRGKDT